MGRGALGGALGLVLALCGSTAAWAQATDPKFTYADGTTREDLTKAEEIEWKASAQAGLVVTTGNAQVTTASGGIKASRKANRNKFQLEAGGVYARSKVVVGVEDGEAVREAREISNALSTTGRYDRFLSDRDSLYVSASFFRDVLAGKEAVVGGQLGYSRSLIKTERASLLVEAGYDFAFEVPVDADGVPIHSLRLFSGYTRQLTEDTGIDLSLEGLFNINSYEQSMRDVSAFEDTRINGALGLTTKLFSDISFRFAFSARYDNVPVQLTFMGTPYEAENLDTKTEATLIVNFL
ncbi:DUF481 domain-containing protein [Haliangium ochraceum]|uniref:DUF481 domain-containing protein n=1 Tax=Haliangium ochraceum TaxID=80816 RepID=UPI00019BAB64|nr:DUF481 domain-containing protein [Haliangium ochraceum]